MPYQLPDVWKQPVKEKIWDLLRLKITTPCSFNIVPIRKPDGKVRVCVDYRCLNSITNPDPYYISLVDELLQKVESSQVLSKLDLGCSLACTHHTVVQLVYQTIDWSNP